MQVSTVPTCFSFEKITFSLITFNYNSLGVDQLTISGFCLQEMFVQTLSLGTALIELLKSSSCFTVCNRLGLGPQRDLCAATPNFLALCHLVEASAQAPSTILGKG